MSYEYVKFCFVFFLMVRRGIDKLGDMPYIELRKPILGVPMLDYDYLSSLLPSDINLKSLSFEDFKYLMCCHGSLDDTAINVIWDFYSSDDDDPSLLDIIQSWHQWDWDKFAMYYLTADSLDFVCFHLGDTVLFEDFCLYEE